MAALKAPTLCPMSINGDESSFRSQRSAASSASSGGGRRVRFPSRVVTSIVTYDPFAARNNSCAEYCGDVLPGDVRVALASIQLDCDGRRDFIRYGFNIVVEGRVVHDICDRYSVIRKKVDDAARVCPRMPSFPPRRCWRDNTHCDRNVRQRAAELQGWLQCVLAGPPRNDRLLDRQRHVAGLKILGLKKKSYVARLLREAATARKLLADGMSPLEVCRMQQAAEGCREDSEDSPMTETTPDRRQGSTDTVESADTYGISPAESTTSEDESSGPAPDGDEDGLAIDC
eukprot:TRINITY_DN2674_c0_g2_i1.p1 TRINITY_DN2674_c0_g2~~TRINITY_DN2674_c0_g2_i1.p1  ORF type:complete len:287 (+),score=97.75 TRINITY_DN2674_c0_g2_i1:81-941(+)